MEEEFKNPINGLRKYSIYTTIVVGNPLFTNSEWDTLVWHNEDDPNMEKRLPKTFKESHIEKTVGTKNSAEIIYTKETKRNYVIKIIFLLQK